MSSLYVVILDHNAVSIKRRERDARECWSDLPRMLEELAVREYLPLHTCNRSELYLVANSPDAARCLAPAGADVLNGRLAARHLLRVLLGLESLARGESHIVAQVKRAYAGAPHRGRMLHRLFQRAFGLASDLRTRYHPGREPSIQFLAVGFLQRRMSSGRVLVAGLGAFGTETASLLISRGFDVTLANRTPRKASDLPGELRECRVVSWEDLLLEARTSDAVFLCTGAESPILRTEFREAASEALLFDLGSPPQSGDGPGKRITLDDLRETAKETLAGYGRSLSLLEEEAERASDTLYGELCAADDVWKVAALTRAKLLVKNRARMRAVKLDVPPEELEAFGDSILRSFLHPLLADAGDSARTWRLLAGGDDRDG